MTKIKRPPKTDVLETHGTTMGGLPPSSVLQAAEEDFKRKDRNKGGGFTQYAFLRKHVHKSVDPRELLERALLEYELGSMSHKKGTRLIYKDTETLAAACELAAKKYPLEEKKDVNLG